MLRDFPESFLAVRSAMHFKIRSVFPVAVAICIYSKPSFTISLLQTFLHRLVS